MTAGAGGLPPSAVALAVVAHPDDESFGMGAVLSALAAAGTRVTVVCFTHGEASTLVAGLTGDEQLHSVRAAEMEAAAVMLGLQRVELFDFPDGRLSEVAVDALADVVRVRAREAAADLLVVFDHGGITGHPDHVHATAAALVAADHLDLPVLAWAIPETVADELNTQFGTTFAGRSTAEVDHWVSVDRDAQLRAIACHRSQSAANPVLWRRLELTGQQEPLRMLRARTGLPSSPIAG